MTLSVPATESAPSGVLRAGALTYVCPICGAGVTSVNNLVRIGGTVEYTVVIVNGNRTIPANSRLDVTTDQGYDSTLSGPCEYGNTAVNVPLGGLTMPEISAQGAITCKFLVVVNGTHKDSGEIAPFRVTAELSGPGINASNHIPAAYTPSVPVHTGGELSSMSSEVMLDDSTTYFKGGCCML